MAMKKSLFSKPAWAAKTAPAAGRDQPIFGQDVYEDILEANRKKEERRLAKQKEHEEQKAQKSKRQSINTKIDDEQVIKRRRISTDSVHADEGEEESEDIRSNSENSVNTSDDKEDEDEKHNSKSSRNYDSEDNHVSSTQSTPRKSKRLAQDLESNSPPKSLKQTMIVIDDEDEEDIQVISKTVRRSSLQVQTRNSKSHPLPAIESDAESEEEDEYIRELKRKARAEAREKRRHTAVSETSKEQEKSRDGNQYSKDLRDLARDNGVVEALDMGTPTPMADPRDPSDTRVQILISTMIPNCSGLVVERFASQPLDKVFSYWKRRNNLAERKLAEQVFFIWTGQKLYNSTTTRSILEQIKRRHGSKSDGSDLAEGKIEIEAVIPEIYQHRLKQRERLRAEAEGIYINTTNESNDPSNEAEAALEIAREQNPGIVIHLKSKDKDILPFLNLRVRPDTTVQRIINGYKKKVKLDSSRQVYLVFDGERLQNEANVEKIGLEDEDAVDVME